MRAGRVGAVQLLEIGKNIGDVIGDLMIAVSRLSERINLFDDTIDLSIINLDLCRLSAGLL